MCVCLFFEAMLSQDIKVLSNLLLHFAHAMHTMAYFEATSQQNGMNLNKNRHLLSVLLNVVSKCFTLLLSVFIEPLTVSELF